MVKKIYKILLFFACIFLVSCTLNIQNTTSSVVSSSSISEDVTSNFSSNSTSEEPISSLTSSEIEYEKDENNFYKLDKSMYYEALSKDGNSKIEYAEIDKDYPRSTSLRLYQEGKEIPLYNVKVNNNNTFTESNYNRIDNSVGIIAKNGPITLVLATNFTLRYGITIRPLAKNIDCTYDETTRLIKFTIEQTGQYTIEFRLNRTLHLFVDEIGQYDEYKSIQNVEYFAPGIHNHQNDSRINSNHEYYVPSNKIVFLDYGCIFQGAFVSSNTNSITIVGGGIVDGSCFVRNASTNERKIPIDFNFVNGAKILGVSFLDSAGWTLNIYFNKNVTINNVKIISSRANGDGISLQSCQDVHVDNCFTRTWDDSLVVKNYLRWDNRSIQGETRNIYFNNCLIWTDLAQSIEIGYETIGKVMDNIHFENITVLHNFHKPAISIHNANNADVTNVYYKNIVIEDASMGKGDGVETIFELTTLFSSTWSTNHTTTELGSISNVYFENIDVLEGKSNLKVNLLGCIDTRSGYNNSRHEINEVHFKNVNILGNKFDETYQNFVNNEYVHNIVFEN